MLYEQQRREIIDVCRRMSAEGMTPGLSGNISIRVGDHVVITPSGLPYDALVPEQLCIVDLDGSVVEADAHAAGGRPVRPSTEVPMHTLIYRHSDAAAIVHAHPLHATALGMLVDETPAVHYMLASFGGPVRVAPYARFGTDELAENVRVAMADRSAVLLRNHGLTCWADTLSKAYDKALQLEWACELALLTMSAGRPTLLSTEQVDEVAREMKRTGYGA